LDNAGDVPEPLTPADVVKQSHGRRRSQELGTAQIDEERPHRELKPPEQERGRRAAGWRDAGAGRGFLRGHGHGATLRWREGRTGVRAPRREDDGGWSGQFQISVTQPWSIRSMMTRLCRAPPSAWVTCPSTTSSVAATSCTVSLKSGRSARRSLIIALKPSRPTG